MKRCPHCDKPLEIPSGEEMKVLRLQTERRVLFPVKWKLVFLSIVQLVHRSPSNPEDKEGRAAYKNRIDDSEIHQFLLRMERNGFTAERFTVLGMAILQDEHLLHLVRKAKYPWKYLGTCIERAVSEQVSEAKVHQDEASRFHNLMKSLHKTE